MLIPVVGGPYHGEVVETRSAMPIHEFPLRDEPGTWGAVERYLLRRGFDGIAYVYEGTRSLLSALPDEEE